MRPRCEVSFSKENHSRCFVFTINALYAMLCYDWRCDSKISHKWYWWMYPWNWFSNHLPKQMILKPSILSVLNVPLLCTMLPIIMMQSSSSKETSVLNVLYFSPIFPRFLSCGFLLHIEAEWFIYASGTPLSSAQWVKAGNDGFAICARVLCFHRFSLDVFRLTKSAPYIRIWTWWVFLTGTRI